jgi:ABC-2 type transport system ATP-binding protein
VAPFGTTLHVVGADRGKLTATIAELEARKEITAEEGQTSLEDVFIQFMGKSQDNMA